MTPGFGLPKETPGTGWPAFATLWQRAEMDFAGQKPQEPAIPPERERPLHSNISSFQSSMDEAASRPPSEQAECQCLAKRVCGDIRRRGIRAGGSFWNCAGQIFTLDVRYRNHCTS